MFDNLAVGIDNYEAGRDALELAKQLVPPDGDMLLVFVQVVMRAPGPDTDPNGSSTSAGARWSGSPRCETMRTPRRSC
jgi:hypothetical protein